MSLDPMIKIELSLCETKIYISALHWVIFGHLVRTARPSLPVIDDQLIALHDRIIESWPKVADDSFLHGAEEWLTYEIKQTLGVDCSGEELTAIILCLDAVLNELDGDRIEMEVVMHGDPGAVANVKNRLLEIQRHSEGE
jgi:hypothetical protein